MDDQFANLCDFFDGRGTGVGRTHQNASGQGGVVSTNRKKKHRVIRPPRPLAAADSSAAWQPAFTPQSVRDARQEAADLFAAEIEADAGVRRPFTACIDRLDWSLKFVSPSVTGLSGGRPTSRPELLLLEAVNEIVRALVPPASSPATGAAPTHRYIHLSGHASSKYVRQSSAINLIRTLLAITDEGGRCEMMQIRADGNSVAFTLSDSEEYARIPAPTPEPEPIGTVAPETLGQLDTFSQDLIPRHQAVVSLVQQLLDALAGKRARSIEDNRKIAAVVNAISDDFGVAVMYDGRPVAVRVVPLSRDPAGSFQLRLTGSDPKAVKTSMAFPPLAAVSRAGLSRGSGAGPEVASSASTDRGSRTGR